jgi:hypothetical protein
MLSFQQAVHVGESRRQDLLRAAEREKLINQIRATQPSRWDHLLAWSGDWLINAGQRLKARRPISQPTFVQLSIE